MKSNKYEIEISEPLLRAGLKIKVQVSESEVIAMTKKLVEMSEQFNSQAGSVIKEGYRRGQGNALQKNA